MKRMVFWIAYRVVRRDPEVSNEYIASKHLSETSGSLPKLHVITTQEIILFIATTVRTSNPKELF
jgi:hypothetical protein